MTGEKQQIDLSEEAVNTDGNQLVPDPMEESTMVATSVEVYNYLFCAFFFLSTNFDSVWLQALEELGLDATDLVDEAPYMFESQKDGEYNLLLIVSD